MNANGSIEHGLRQTTLHRDTEALSDLSSVGSKNVKANHLVLRNDSSTVYKLHGGDQRKDMTPMHVTQHVKSIKITRIHLDFLRQTHCTPCLQSIETQQTVRPQATLTFSGMTVMTFKKQISSLGRHRTCSRGLKKLWNT